jgi:hypothetical protein
VTKETVSKTATIGRTFDQTGKIGNDEFKIVLYPNDTKVWFECGEGVISDLGLRRGNTRDKGGLAHAWETDESNVGHQLEFKIEPLLLADFTLFRKGGGAANIRKETGVALSSTTARGRHPAIPLVNEIGQHRSFEVMNDGALGDKNDEIVGSGSVHFLALTMDAVWGSAVRMVFEGKQRRDISISNKPDIAAPATIAAIGSTFGHMRLTTEGNAACAAVSAFDI